MAQLYCVLDYETRSTVDITAQGGYEYARHASTRVLCIAWRLGTLEEIETAPIRIWSPFIPETADELPHLLKCFSNPSIKLVAHNAFFEQVITRFVLVRYVFNRALRKILQSLPVSRWLCTASLARSVALPGKLEKATAALKLPYQKDMVGHRLMLKISKPRRPRKGEDPAKIYWHKKLSDLRRVMDYCIADVAAETALLLRLPPLQPFERKVWELDQRINWRGFRVDRELAKRVIKWIKEETTRAERELKVLTRGQVETVNQLQRILKWLNANGLALPNLQKKTVEDCLNEGLATGKCKELLELRQDLARASTKKFAAFILRSAFDGRIRDSLVFHTASTGRFGGAGLQPHNFPRIDLKKLLGLDNPQAAHLLEVIRILLDPATDLELIRMLWGSPLYVFSQILRPIIQASEGCELFGGDFSGIEVRVLFWLAGHAAGLRAYEEGRDLYCEIASIIYGRKITKADPVERQLGKESILGSGFGLGWKGFFTNCKLKGMEVTPELARRAVQAYRSQHAPVVRLWYNLERAAMAAVRNPGKRYTINKTTWYVRGEYLWCELPSGKRLAYYGPKILPAKKPWGETSDSLWHWDIHPKTKKWVFVSTHGGKLAENVTQGTAADLMKAAMLRVEERDGYRILITVHDEILGEHKKGKRTLKHFIDAMSEAPAWAEGLPIKVEGFNNVRYIKG